MLSQMFASLAKQALSYWTCFQILHMVSVSLSFSQQTFKGIPYTEEYSLKYTCMFFMLIRVWVTQGYTTHLLKLTEWYI